jgi:isopenicillin N synthase-like dioxygenase
MADSFMLFILTFLLMISSGCHSDEKLKISDDYSVPCFDIFAIDSNPSCLEKEDQINFFCESLHEEGFVAIKADRIKPLLESVYEQAKAYFDLDIELKLTHKMNSSFRSNGYDENENRRIFQCDANFKEFPENLPHFETGMENYFQECSRYMKCALKIIMKYCENSDTDFLETENTLRLLKYLPPDNPNDLWFNPHTDGDALTFFSSTDVPGLQIWTKEKKWIDLIVPKGYLILIIGRDLGTKSAGYFQPTIHQVVFPNEEWKGRDRYSCVFLAYWPRFLPLNPFDKCLLLNTSERQNH